jgi:hypothetical protein
MLATGTKPNVRAHHLSAFLQRNVDGEFTQADNEPLDVTVFEVTKQTPSIVGIRPFQRTKIMSNPFVDLPVSLVQMTSTVLLSTPLEVDSPYIVTVGRLKKPSSYTAVIIPHTAGCVPASSGAPIISGGQLVGMNVGSDLTLHLNYFIKISPILQLVDAVVATIDPQSNTAASVKRFFANRPIPQTSVGEAVDIKSIIRYGKAWTESSSTASERLENDKQAAIEKLALTKMRKGRISTQDFYDEVLNMQEWNPERYDDSDAEDLALRLVNMGIPVPGYGDAQYVKYSGPPQPADVQKIALDLLVDADDEQTILPQPVNPRVRVEQLAPVPTATVEQSAPAAKRQPIIMLGDPSAYSDPNPEFETIHEMEEDFRRAGSAASTTQSAPVYQPYTTVRLPLKSSNSTTPSALRLTRKTETGPMTAEPSSKSQPGSRSVTANSEPSLPATVSSSRKKRTRSRNKSKAGSTHQ